MKINEMSWKASDGITIAAQSWEPDQSIKAVVCLVHGLGEHIRRYNHVATAFTNAGYAVLGADLRGHGMSEGPRGHTPNYDQYLSDIDLEIDHAKEIFPGKPIFIYGHSLGGNLVLYYCLKRTPKLAGALVTSPGLKPGEEVPGWKTALAKILYSVAPTFTMDNGLDLMNLSHDTKVIDAYRSDPLVHSKISARFGMDFLNAGQWIRENAQKLDIPILLMQGTADHLVSPEATREFAKKVKCEITYKEWPDLYHELHNEFEKATVIQTMIDWLDQHTPIA